MQGLVCLRSAPEARERQIGRDGCRSNLGRVRKIVVLRINLNLTLADSCTSPKRFVERAQINIVPAFVGVHVIV